MNPYTTSLVAYTRNKTRGVHVGDVVIGNGTSIKLQSMTTVDTMDTQGSVDQSIRMIEHGCEIVRITAPSKKEAQNLQEIKDKLRALGHQTPLVADIHFTPNAAEIAARIVEKVRVNPGNYADKKKFDEITYTDEAYEHELIRIEEKFTPLVLICKEEGVAMRIGTNHGSLSDRILGRYGDTPKGMVESALEFLRICRKHDYHNIVLSMKASNTLVMVQAYRLLVHAMSQENMDYPLHLGVTEAGDGEDGRIKSAVGIGTLLEDGLGDTIRVSLTEEPEFEIPVARKLVERYQNRVGHDLIPEISNYPIDPFSYKRRKSTAAINIGDHHVPVVIGDLSALNEIKPASLFAYGHIYSVPLDKWNAKDQAIDYAFVGDNKVGFEIPGHLGIIQNKDNWESERQRHYPLFGFSDFLKAENKSAHLNFVQISIQELFSHINDVRNLPDSTILVFTTSNLHGMAEQRRMFVELMNEEIHLPVIIKRTYRDINYETFQLHSSTDLGALFIDGLGDGLWLDAIGCASPMEIVSTSFGILQATRTRISKTEYISCPSCGRTLFDLQETTAKIRAVTSHLKGVKIGIMGCIVNGPGEMADADYGYVGTGPGKITLYKEKEVVQKNIPELEAVDALIDLIKQHGDWIEAN